MKETATAALFVVGIAAIIAITYFASPRLDKSPEVRAPTADGEWRRDDGVGPQLSAPIKLRKSFRILCSSVDAGTTTTECGVPVDGGTAGYPIPASSIYIAPAAASSVKVRVGSADVTSATGFEVGTGARDGVGVTVDATGCWCKSEGAAQAADVVVAQ